MLQEFLSGPSLGGVLVQTLLDEVLELCRPLGIDGRRVLLYDIIEHTRVMLSDVGWLSLGKLNSENAEGPDVYLVGVLLVLLGLDQLGCHPADSANLTCPCLLLLCEHDSVPKVSQLDLSVLLAKDVV